MKFSHNRHGESQSKGIYIIAPGSAPAVPDVVFSSVDPEAVVSMDISYDKDERLLVSEDSRNILKARGSALLRLLD